MSGRAAPILPGRLGNPDMTLADDPRADPRMIAALAPLGIGGPVEPFPLTVDHPLEDLHAYADEGEQGFGAVGDVLLQGLDPVTGVTRSVEVIPGVDGNDITLYISRPEAADGALPGILHIHGGGMVFLEASGALYVIERRPSTAPRDTGCPRPPSCGEREEPASLGCRSARGEGRRGAPGRRRPLAPYRC